MSAIDIPRSAASTMPVRSVECPPKAAPPDSRRMQIPAWESLAYSMSCGAERKWGLGVGFTARETQMANRIDSMAVRRAMDLST